MLDVIGATVAVDKYPTHYRGSALDWPCLVLRSKTVEPNVAPGYFSGQTASTSHPDSSPDSLGPPA